MDKAEKTPSWFFWDKLEFLQDGRQVPQSTKAKGSQYFDHAGSSKHKNLVIPVAPAVDMCRSGCKY